MLRDLGITFGQGYFLGHPDRQPLAYLGSDAQRILDERQVAVFPEISRASAGGHLRSLSLVLAPTVTFETINDELAKVFMGTPNLHAIAVTAGERPVAIINRARFMTEALGEGGTGVLHAIKAALDPTGVLNPGKLGLPNPFGPVPFPAAVGEAKTEAGVQP